MVMKMKIQNISITYIFFTLLILFFILSVSSNYAHANGGNNGNHYGWCRGVGNPHHNANCNTGQSGTTHQNNLPSGNTGTTATSTQLPTTGNQLPPTNQMVLVVPPQPKPQVVQKTPQPMPQAVHKLYSSRFHRWFRRHRSLCHKRYHKLYSSRFHRWFRRHRSLCRSLFRAYF